MERTFKIIVDDLKYRSKQLRKNGRRCCGNQVLNIATELEHKLKDLKLEKEEKQSG